MSKNKYCYAIVKKENGDMAITDGKLPIYWLKKVAEEMFTEYAYYDDKYCLTKILLSDVEKLILSSKPIK